MMVVRGGASCLGVASGTCRARGCGHYGTVQWAVWGGGSPRVGHLTRMDVSSSGGGRLAGGEAPA